MRPITFAAPRIKRYATDEFQPSGEPRFVAVSLMGARCELMCDHCRTRMLAALHRATTPADLLAMAERLHARGCQGMLLTGGCDSDGVIPLAAFTAAAREVKQRFGIQLAAHSKLATEAFAQAAEEAGIDLLMLDVVGDEDSLHHVYHLHGKTLGDVVASLDRAEAHGLPLAPHIMLGLANGQVHGEWRALEMLRGRRNLRSLVLVVLTPLRMTPMAAVKIDLPGVLEFMSSARREFPDVSMTLGCAKTGGAMQRRLEEHALALGFDAIAYPSEGIVAEARALGRQVQFSEECCAFLGQM